MALTFPTFKELVFSKKGPLVELFELVKTQLNALDTRINAMDGAGEIELTQLEHSTEGKIIAYNASGVATAKKIDVANMNIFESTEQTGTGEAQNIAHGLAATPSMVFIELTSVGTDGATVTYTKGSTNVIVTATTGAKYIVHAIA